MNNSEHGKAFTASFFHKLLIEIPSLYASISDCIDYPAVWITEEMDENRMVEGVDFEIKINCPACGGDGKETCNNPDHGFIGAMPGEIGRLGCPGCGHDPDHKVNRGRNKCPQCGGHGHVTTEVFQEYVRETGYEEEPELVAVPKNIKEELVLNFIKLIRDSFIGSTEVYTQGSCYQFYKILKYVFPEAVAWFNISHVITEIGGKYYDITGEVEKTNHMLMEEHFSNCLTKESRYSLYSCSFVHCTDGLENITPAQRVSEIMNRYNISRPYDNSSAEHEINDYFKTIPVQPHVDKLRVGIVGPFIVRNNEIEYIATMHGLSATGNTKQQAFEELITSLKNTIALNSDISINEIDGMAKNNMINELDFEEIIYNNTSTKKPDHKHRYITNADISNIFKTISSLLYNHKT